MNPGNIIIVDGRPKLNDFEYARHESNRTPHEKIVSASFLPARTRPDVSQGTRNFRPTEVELEDFTFFDDATVEIPLPDFRYFPLHDLESLWWMSLYFAAGRVVVDDGTGHTWSEEEEAAQINMQLEGGGGHVGTAASSAAL